MKIGTIFLCCCDYIAPRFLLLLQGSHIGSPISSGSKGAGQPLVDRQGHSMISQCVIVGNPFLVDSKELSHISVSLVALH